MQLVELEDLPWFPALIRDFATDYLQFAIALGKPYAPILERLLGALEKTDARRIVDLCSGGGGPWPTMVDVLPAGVSVQLTDKYPNVNALQRVEQLGIANISYAREPVDATAVPADLGGFRTLYSSFHHFAPDGASAILADAVFRREGIGIFEATQRSAPAIFTIFAAIVILLLCTPFIRPFRITRILFTYLVPIVPFIVLFDGIVSCLRTYSPAELKTLVEGVPDNETYDWEIGEQSGGRNPIPITYLIGHLRESA